MKARIAEATIFAALTYFLFASVLPAWAEAAQGSGYHWSKVRMGAKDVNSTLAGGTNDAGWVAGNWWKQGAEDQPSSAFRFKGGKFIPFGVPGAEETFVADIESSSTIVGYYTTPDGPEGSVHAYLYKHGLNAFDNIDVPGAIWTFPFRVNAKRQVAVGYFWFNGTGTDWLAGIYDWTTKQVTPVSVFGYTNIVIRGLNNHGEVVGSFAVPDPGDPCTCQFWDNGFYRSADGQEIHLTDPGGGPVFPQAINDHGVIVGETWKGTGFRWDLNTGDYLELPHPVRQDGFRTYIADIDNKGRMVAVNERWSDGYTESWWLRPLPKKVARR